MCSSIPPRLRRRAKGLLAVLAAIGSSRIAFAEDNSPAAILQWFDSSYRTIERRTPDVFMAGYGAVWTPPPGRADISDFSVGYDVYDRFDLGSPNHSTLYGTETGLKTVAGNLHRAGLDLHVDFVLNHNGYSGTGDQSSRDAFKQAGGYPGFFLDFFNDPDGDFNSAYSYGDVQGRLAGLIDIAHNKNYRAIRSPVPGFANNIAAGTVGQNGRLANVALESNRRFYPDHNLQPIYVFDPITGEQNIPVYPFNPSSPLAGDPTEENALGYLMRNAQWLVQVVGVDGLRIDAAKHVDGFVLDYLDRAIYRQNPRNLLDGSQKNVFAYSEVYDGDRSYLLTHVKKNINPNDPGRIGGNRDTLDFAWYFALKNNLEHAGQANAWQNIRNADLDVFDDGLHNGSAGVKFVSNHDVFKPFDLDNVANAYTLMMPGNATVYFNGKEFGDNRDFPKSGRSDALSVKYGSQLTNLLDIRNTHGRGNYAERWIDDQGTFVFERVSSAVVGLSNRGDGGYDTRYVEVGFAPGTHLVELTGNHQGVADPYDNIPEVVTVYHDDADNKNKIEMKIPRNRNANGTWTGDGYIVYGLPTPQAPGGLQLSAASSINVLSGSGNPSNNYENGVNRQTDVAVVKDNSFRVRLQTNEVRLLVSDALRDIYADGDNALLKIDGGRDTNHNGHVDFVQPNSVQYGFESFGTKSSPLIGPQGISGPRGDGEFIQDVDATQLEEGYHYLDARAFRHRTDGGPAVFNDFKKVIYVDRLKPISGVASFDPYVTGVNENRELRVRSMDLTAENVHVFLDVPASTTENEILSWSGNGSGKAGQIDRDLFAYGFNNLSTGNHVATIVTYEMTGTYNVQRVPGLFVSTSIGNMGDLDFNGIYSPNDAQLFFSLARSNNAFFNPAADFDANGIINNGDWKLFGDFLKAGHNGLPIIETFDSLNANVPEPAVGVGLVVLVAAAGRQGIHR